MEVRPAASARILELGPGVRAIPEHPLLLPSTNRRLGLPSGRLNVRGGDRQPFCVPAGRREGGRPDGAVGLGTEVQAAVLPGGRGGQQRGQRQVREPLPGVEMKRRDSGSVPRLETTPAPQPNPRERPGRRRVWRRKRPETVQFHAASGARVPGQER